MAPGSSCCTGPAGSTTVTLKVVRPVLASITTTQMICTLHAKLPLCRDQQRNNMQCKHQHSKLHQKPTTRKCSMHTASKVNMRCTCLQGPPIQGATSPPNHHLIVSATTATPPVVCLTELAACIRAQLQQVSADLLWPAFCADRKQVQHHSATDHAA